MISVTLYSNSSSIQYVSHRKSDSGMLIESKVGPIDRLDCWKTLVPYELTIIGNLPMCNELIQLLNVSLTVNLVCSSRQPVSTYLDHMHSVQSLLLSMCDYEPREHIGNAPGFLGIHDTTGLDKPSGFRPSSVLLKVPLIDHINECIFAHCHSLYVDGGGNDKTPSTYIVSKLDRRTLNAINACKVLSSLYTSHLALSTQQLASILSTMASHIVFYHCTVLERQCALLTLASNPCVVALELDVVGIDDDSFLRILDCLPHLGLIKIASKSITSTFFDRFAKMQELTYIDLSGCFIDNYGNSINHYARTLVIPEADATDDRLLLKLFPQASVLTIET